jgi:hypothetical protein
MKRARLSNFLGQRQLIRKLSRQSARRCGTVAWMYRDYVCTIAMDANSGQFVGSIAGIDNGPTLSGENADELRTAIHHAVDTHLNVDVASEDNDGQGQ